jgi:hypothetical protein
VGTSSCLARSVFITAIWLAPIPKLGSFRVDR